MSFQRVFKKRIFLGFLLAVFFCTGMMAGVISLTINVVGGGFVVPGKQLQFTAQISKREPCKPDVEWQYSVMSAQSDNWKSESFTPVWSGGTTTTTHTFTNTYTIPPGTPPGTELCFAVIEDSVCNVQWMPAAKTCITTSPLKFHIKDLEAVTYLDCFPFPGCPLCLNVDLKALISQLGNPPDIYQVQLFRGNRQVALLGQFGKGMRLLDQAKIELLADEIGLIQRGPVSGFQLRIIDSKGQVVQTQEISLKMR